MSVLIFFLIIYSMDSYILNQAGKDVDIWSLSITIYTAIIFVR